MDEFVNIPVPTERTQVVYAVLGAPEQRISEVLELLTTNSATAPEPTTNGAAQWAADGIIRMYRESAERMAGFLDHLADHPGEKFTTEQMAEVLGVTTQQFRGVMGAFGHRTSSRYRWKKWPFEAVWSHADGQYAYTMSADIADIIRGARDE